MGESSHTARAVEASADPPQEANRSRTRIQEKNEARIIAAALDVFAARGFKGATVDSIAANAGMSKANVLYYFKRKQDIYEAVLARTLHVWLDPLAELDPDGDPVTEIWRYTEAKLQLARNAPGASRLFANEILQGAPALRHYLENDLAERVNSVCQILQGWIDDGKLAPVQPLNLLFLIWASTQHYADFEPQIRALEPDSDVVFSGARDTLRHLLCAGLSPGTDTAARS